mgnify:CR=1 FL=1
MFRQNKLDFCCNGGLSLATAANAKGLDLARLESELAEIAAATTANAVRLFGLPA